MTHESDKPSPHNISSETHARQGETVFDAHLAASLALEGGERRPNEEAKVVIKGTRKGLSITLGEGEWQELLRELDARFGEADAFFQGSRVNLHVGKRNINPQQLQELVNVLQNHRVELVSLQTGSLATAAAAQALDVKLALGELASAQTARRVPAEPESSEGLLVRRTLRSGQSLRHSGHVVVIGDVNPGAEIIAGGDVVVWGRLRGMVHAGALGDDDAIVCALELTPTQLRIGTHIALPPEGKKGRGFGRLGRDKSAPPEMASVIDGQIVVEAWSSK